MASHIRVVAILMLVQGALEVLMGGLFAAMGPLVFAVAKWAPAAPGATSPSANVPAGLMAGIYLFMGLPVLAIGIFRIVAGVRNLRYRGRTMGIVALGLGAVSIMTCYCLPTSIGLMVYGLIVYLDQQSQRAFALGEQGHPAAAILAEVLSTGVGPQGEGRFG